MAKIIIDGNTQNEKQPGGIYLDGEPNELLLAIVVAMYASKAVEMLLKNAVGSFEIAKKQVSGNPVKDITVKLDSEARAEFEKLYNK